MCVLTSCPRHAGPGGEIFVSGGLYLGAAAPPGQQIPLWGDIVWRTPETAKSVWEQSVALVKDGASSKADFT